MNFGEKLKNQMIKSARKLNAKKYKKINQMKPKRKFLKYNKKRNNGRKN